MCETDCSLPRTNIASTIENAEETQEPEMIDQGAALLFQLDGGSRKYPFLSIDQNEITI